MISRFTCIAFVLLVVTGGAASAQGCRIDSTRLMPRAKFPASGNRGMLSLAGQVVESDSGNALRLGSVNVMREQNPNPPAASATTTTDGAFRFDSLAMGFYQMDIKRIGYRSVTRIVRLTGHSVVCVTLTMSGHGVGGSSIPSYPAIDASDSLAIATTLGAALGSDLRRLALPEERNNCAPNIIVGQSAAFHVELASAANRTSGGALERVAALGSSVLYSVDAIVVKRSTSAISEFGKSAPYVDSARVAIEVHAEKSGGLLYKESFEEILARTSRGWAHVGREFLISTVGARNAPACR